MSEVIRKSVGWRRFALPASIVLNIFLIAVIGGHVLRHRAIETSSAAPFARALADAMARLSPQDATAFGAVIRRNSPRYAQTAREAADARRKLQAQVIAEPFDANKTREALAAWRAASGRFIDTFGDTLVDALAQVSPEGRRRLVARHRPASRWFSLR
jgi:uncharacterized membrane protein